MYRFHKEKHIIKNRIRFAYIIETRRSINSTSIKYRNFRKVKPFDCTITKCYCCHSSKLLKLKTLKEKIADVNFKEYMNDLLSYKQI